jgi:hypothetical protein
MTNNGGDWETARNRCLTNGARRKILRYETPRDKPSSLLTWTRSQRKAQLGGKAIRGRLFHFLVHLEDDGNVVGYD